jgi:hypothetical protein
LSTRTPSGHSILPRNNHKGYALGRIPAKISKAGKAENETGKFHYPDTGIAYFSPFM